MPATIFSGDKVKALKKKFKLGEGVEVISTDSNPSSGAGLAAPLGSIASDETTGTVYRKSGALATDWVNIASAGAAVTSISKSGSPALTGAVTLSEGSNVTLTQAGQNIQIASTPQNAAFEVVTITTSQTYTSASFSGRAQVLILCNNTTGPITVTLPAANTVAGRVYYIKKLARSTGQPNNITSTITVNATSGQVERSANLILSIIGEGTTLVSDGTNYFEI